MSFFNVFWFFDYRKKQKNIKVSHPTSKALLLFPPTEEFLPRVYYYWRDSVTMCKKTLHFKQSQSRPHPATREIRTQLLTRLVNIFYLRIKIEWLHSGLAFLHSALNMGDFPSLLSFAPLLWLVFVLFSPAMSTVAAKEDASAVDQIVLLNREGKDLPS